MIVVGALDQKPLILKPLECGLPAYDGAGKRRMTGLGRPGADQPLPTLKLGVLRLWLHRILRLCDHAAGHKTWRPRGNHRTYEDPAADLSPMRSSSHSISTRSRLGQRSRTTAQ